MRRFRVKAALIVVALAILALNANYWGPSSYANQLLLAYRLLWLGRWVALALALGVAVVLWRGSRSHQLRMAGAIPMAGMALGALVLFASFSSALPRLDYYRNQVMSCHETNMGAIYVAMMRYWEDHGYRNPRGTGPNGALTQADWQRELMRYRNVWRALPDRNGERMILFHCPSEKGNAWSYEINLDVPPSPRPTGVWLVRETSESARKYHHGYQGMLFGADDVRMFYVTCNRIPN